MEMQFDDEREGQPKNETGENDTYRQSLGEKIKSQRKLQRQSQEFSLNRRQ